MLSSSFKLESCDFVIGPHWNFTAFNFKILHTYTYYLLKLYTVDSRYLEIQGTL